MMDKQPFYAIPFRTEQLGARDSLQKCSLKDSIRQNIRVLLLTPPGRFRYDPYYGCRIHWYQFMTSNHAMQGKKEEDQFRLKLQENLKELIRRFEPRIELTDLEVDMRQDPGEQIPWKRKAGSRGGKNVIQVIIYIKGRIKTEFALDQELELEDTISLV
jgi:phage baseplate assembly protein W